MIMWTSVQVIALLCLLISLIFLVVSLSTTFWLTTGGSFHSGLFG